MFNKKSFFIFILIIISICLISSASAADFESNDIIQEDGAILGTADSLHFSDSNIDLEKSDIAGDLLVDENSLNLDKGASSVKKSDGSKNITVTDKSFQGIQSAIDGADENDTIILDGFYDIVPEITDDYFNKPIYINKTLNVVGINNATLSYHYRGGSYVNGNYVHGTGGSIFYISAGGVTLNGITFENGYTSSDNGYGRGGSVYSSRNLIVRNCRFINSTAEYYGGSIYVGAVAYIDNCSFINSKAYYEKSGAVYMWGDGNITNSYFENCSSSKYGGAIATSESTGFDYSLDVKNCSFVNCNSRYGGAIYKGFCNVNILDSSFINCSATSGGAVYANYIRLNITGSSFENNSATSGGAIAGLSEIYLNGCNFTTNHALENGGALMHATVGGMIANCSFDRNYANSGGSISFNPVYTTSDFFSSGIHWSSEFIYIYYSNEIIMADCNFTDSYATGGSGGAILFYNLSTNLTFCEINLTSCKFVNSSANNGYGGALSFENASSIHLSNCDFENSHSLYGGAINVDELSFGFNITKSTFNRNSADYSGGSIYFLGENGTINNSTFNDNCCPDSGGAVYISENSHFVSFYYCDFNNNSVLKGYLGQNRNGGAICWLAEMGILISCDFNNNSCPDSGGAIYISDATASINLTDCEFNKNSVSSDYSGENYGGGAICSISRSIIVNLCAFMSNYAPYSYGGALYFNRMANTLDSRNVLGSSMLSAGTDSIIRNSEFKDNSAFKASALYSVEETDFLFNKVTLNPGESLDDLFYGISLDSLSSTNSFSRIKSGSSAISSPVNTYYGNKFTVNVISENATAVEYTIKNSKGTVVKSGTLDKGSNITDLSLSVGTYTIFYTTIVDENHTSSNGSASITVNKATAKIKVSALTAYYNSGKNLSITLTDTTNNKPLSGQKITLKVYTGKTYKTITVNTNSKGVANFKTSSLATGTHKVILSYSSSSYNCNQVTSSITIKKIPIKYGVTSISRADGSSLHILVKNKNTNKLINGAKIKLLVYTGKKYKTITLVSAKFSSKGNGYVGYGTNVLSAGTHNVKIVSNDSRYTGTLTVKFIIKSTAKKYPKQTIRISNGKKIVSKN